MSDTLIEKFQNSKKTEIIKMLKDDNVLEIILKLDKPKLDSVVYEITKKLSVGSDKLNSCVETTVDCKILNELRHLEMSFIFNRIDESISYNVISNKVEEATWYRVWQEDIATNEELQKLKELSNVEEQKRYIQEKINDNRTTYLKLPKIFLNKEEQKERNSNIKSVNNQLIFNKASGGEPDVIMYNPHTNKLSFGMANKFVDNKMEGTQDTRHLALLIQTRRTLKEQDLDITKFGTIFNKVVEEFGGKDKETRLWESIVDNTPKEELEKEINELYSISFYQYYNTTTKGQEKYLNVDNNKEAINAYLNSFMFLSQNVYNEQSKYSLTNFTTINTYNTTNKVNLGSSKTINELISFVTQKDVKSFEELMEQIEYEENIEQSQEITMYLEILEKICPNTIVTLEILRKELPLKEIKDNYTLRDQISIELTKSINSNFSEEEYEEIENTLNNEDTSFEEIVEEISLYEGKKLGAIDYSTKKIKRKKISNSLSNDIGTAIKIGFTRNKDYREGMLGLIVEFVIKYNPKLLENELEQFYSKNESSEVRLFSKYLNVEETYTWISNKMNRLRANQAEQKVNQLEQKANQAEQKVNQLEEEEKIISILEKNQNVEYFDIVGEDFDEVKKLKETKIIEIIDFLKSINITEGKMKEAIPVHYKFYEEKLKEENQIEAQPNNEVERFLKLMDKYSKEDFLNQLQEKYKNIENIKVEELASFIVEYYFKDIKDTFIINEQTKSLEDSGFKQLPKEIQQTLLEVIVKNYPSLKEELLLKYGIDNDKYEELKIKLNKEVNILKIDNWNSFKK